jgi:hypothetical protein
VRVSAAVLPWSSERRWHRPVIYWVIFFQSTGLAASARSTKVFALASLSNVQR